jgi:hypothetical protein
MIIDLYHLYQIIFRIERTSCEHLLVILDMIMVMVISSASDSNF